MLGYDLSPGTNIHSVLRSNRNTSKVPTHGAGVNLIDYLAELIGTASRRKLAKAMKIYK